MAKTPRKRASLLRAVDDPLEDQPVSMSDKWVDRYEHSITYCPICGSVSTSCDCGSIQGFIKIKVRDYQVCVDQGKYMNKAIPEAYRGSWKDLWEGLWLKGLEARCRACVHGFQREFGVRMDCHDRRHTEWEPTNAPGGHAGQDT